MSDVLVELNANAGAISGVATFLGVIVAAVYTFYTTRLWKVSVEQSRIAAKQAETAQLQANLLEQQFALAKREFELLQRPHLKIEAVMERYRLTGDEQGDDRSFLAVLGENYGAVAAVVTSAECSVPDDKGAVWGHRSLPILIPPGATEVIGRAVLPSVPSESDIADFDNYVKEQMLFFHVYIAYEGVGVEYSTARQIWLMPDVRNRNAWAVYGVTPSGTELEKLRSVSSSNSAA